MDPSRAVGAGALRHPITVLSVPLVLLAVYGWTFIVHPHHLAPRLDPAYYSWRIETLISDKPSTLFTIRGPFGAVAGGYRVASNVLGGYLREVAGVSLLKTTVVMVVAQWTVIALLLAGFAYRHRRDPLIFLAVAAGSGSLLLNFPFIGYADNTLCLLFLGAAIWFIPDVGGDWTARIAFALFLVVCGFTHPTTLAVFCVALVVITALRMVVARSASVGTLVRDGGVLATAATAIAVMYISWSAGIWGVSQSLSEAASPPPKTGALFLTKSALWIKTMFPLWNGPLLAIGIIGVTYGLRKQQPGSDLARITLGWLSPLLGVLGFVLGLTYPYYRFFNSTLAWVLLVGVGAYMVVRYCLEVAHHGGAARFALIGVLAVVLAIAANFYLKVSEPEWTSAHGGWLTATKQRDLDALRAALESRDRGGRPVVFVIDLASGLPSKIYGFAKNSGNVFRYGLPSRELDKAYLYLGSLTDFLSHRSTPSSESTYRRLSGGYLSDASQGIQRSGKRPIVVVSKEFNLSGTNAKFFDGIAAPPSSRSADIWLVSKGQVTTSQGPVAARQLPHPPAWHLVTVMLGMLLLLLPGLVAVRRVIFRPSLAEMLGMVPALSMALLACSGIVVLAVARASFSGELPWVSVAFSIGLAFLIPPAHRPLLQGDARGGPSRSLSPRSETAL
jgi:hypothetical protein